MQKKEKLVSDSETSGDEERQKSGNLNGTDHLQGECTMTEPQIFFKTLSN